MHRLRDVGASLARAPAGPAHRGHHGRVGFGQDDDRPGPGGHPLDDEDRAPWLAAVAARIDQWRDDGKCGVVACSALKRRYRDIIIGGRADVRLIYLEGSRALIGERLAQRHDHFMPASLLDSQFAALEPPDPEEDAITVSVDAPVDTTVAQLAAALATGHDPHRCALTG